MRSKISCLLGLGLSAIAFARPVTAQTPPPTNPPPPTVSVRAADLQITPRAGASYSTSGGGYDGFTTFQGFFPLQQTPGQNLLYLVGQLLLDNDANLGGNLLVGYRTYNPGANRIYGGYLAYDSRDTGFSVFSQLGVGVETLGDAWDARLNAYVPVGSTRQTVSDVTFTSGLQLTNLRFQNNFLLASGSNQQTRIRDIEAAMSGFDAEAGGRILRFSDYGDLRGYAGLYYISAGDSALGVRGRLEARPTDNLAFGLAVQHDGLFGTNVVATVSLSLPGTRPRGADPKSVLARMGEYPGRLNAIVVDRQRETTITGNAFADTPVQNPATGQPYLFQHVTLGTNGGNGTFESPFGVLQAALDSTQSDGNAIVYVQAGTNPGIPAFTIPDGVQVLSTAPTQFLNAALSGQSPALLQLPLSGLGASLPNVVGTVTMRSNTVLSGFNITSTTGAGVTFTNVNSVEIRDNIIRNTADAGILGNGVAIANLFRNQISGATNQGIFIQNVGTATVTDNVITGILGGPTSIANPISGDITLPIPGGGTVTVPNPGSIVPLRTGQGIVITSASGATNISRNTIANTATQGIVLLNAAGTVAIADNTISNTVGADETFTLPAPLGGTIALPTGQGIVVAGVNTATVDILRNTVTNTRGQGLVLGAGTGTFTIDSNTFTQNLDQGVSIGAIDGTLTIRNNRITDTSTRPITGISVPNPLGGVGTANFATGQGLFLAGVVGTVNISNNVIERIAGSVPTGANFNFPGGQGIALAAPIGQLTLNLSGNQIWNTDNDGMLLGLGVPGSGGPGVTANVTIANNTLEAIGGTAPIRGDAIAIQVSDGTVLTPLVIENNIIQTTGDDGIDLRVQSSSAAARAQVVGGVIRNNTITNSFQKGVEVQATLAGTASLTLENNTISRSGPGDPGSPPAGIFLETIGIGPQISATMRGNTLNNVAGTPGVFARTTPGTNQQLCVNLIDNTSTTGYTLSAFQLLPIVSLPIQEVTGNTNTGIPFTRTGPITPVGACPP